MRNGISALMDGELDAEDAASIIARLHQSADLRDEWATYHLIGDALRQSMTIPDITQRVSARLADEPTVLAPRPLHTQMAHKAKVYALPVAAAVAAVAIVGWMSLQTIERPAQENLVAAKPAPASAIQAVPAVAVAALAPAQMNGYLLAHQEYSPSTTFQGVAPYVRTVADTQGRAAR